MFSVFLSVHRGGLRPLDLGGPPPDMCWTGDSFPPTRHGTRQWVAPHQYDIWWTDLELVGLALLPYRHPPV